MNQSGTLKITHNARVNFLLEIIWIQLTVMLRL
jgi:hypothetical protein